MDAYATAAQLVEWLPSGTVVDDADRLLRRASEVVDGAVRIGFAVAEETGLPTDSTIATACSEACCAQVEYWLDVGEEHDIEGLTGGAAIGSLRIDQLPPELAPRARRILGLAGLIGQPAPTARSGCPW
jgi:hypothetical protein